jgi:AcrR family transcriptional regulator
MASATPASSSRRRIDRHEVVLAACALLDEGGQDGFSMARVGRRLGVTAMALYRHVKDRDDLESAIVDHVLADLMTDEVVADDGDSIDDWEAAVATWMYRVRSHWLRHPWIGRLIGGDHALSPSWLGALGRLARALEDAGLPPEAVAREVVQISRVVVGVTVLEAQAPLPHTETFEPEALARLKPDERARWESLAVELDRYANDELFADIVRQTVSRISESLANGSAARRSRR